MKLALCNYTDSTTATAPPGVVDPGAQLTILVPISLSEDPEPALAFAGDLACRHDAKVVLLHVLQLNIAGEERGFARARLLDELARAAETRLSGLAAGLGSRTDVDALVCEGHPAKTIVEAARHLRADSIVLRMHRHRIWLNWLHRNTGLAVARQAPCRVWLLSSGDRDARRLTSFISCLPNPGADIIFTKSNAAIFCPDGSRERSNYIAQRQQAGH